MIRAFIGSAKKIKRKIGFTRNTWETASRLEPLRGGSLFFTTKFPETPGTHFIDLGRMKGWVDLGATQRFWTEKVDQRFFFKYCRIWQVKFLMFQNMKMITLYVWEKKKLILLDLKTHTGIHWKSYGMGWRYLTSLTSWLAMN